MLYSLFTDGTHELRLAKVRAQSNENKLPSQVTNFVFSDFGSPEFSCSPWFVFFTSCLFSALNCLTQKSFNFFIFTHNFKISPY